MAAGWRKFTGVSPYPELTANSDRSNFTYGNKKNRGFRMSWIQGKRDPIKERAVLDWIAKSTGKSLPNDPEEVAEKLADGVILCEFLQSLNRNSLAKKITRKPTRFAAAENLLNFQDGLVALGLDDSQLFPIIDLTEKHDLTSLVESLIILKIKLGIR